MRKLKRWIRQWLNDDSISLSKESPQLVSDSESLTADPVLNFRVYNAVGGKVVEFRYYDRGKDRNHNQTYIITNDQDFGERIAKIATLESLKT
jgi:hypothetical protein